MPELLLVAVAGSGRNTGARPAPPAHADAKSRTSSIDRSVQRFVTYWRQMVFTGKGMPPKSFASESDLVDFVARTPGSVGYVSTSVNVSSVKKLELE